MNHPTASERQPLTAKLWWKRLECLVKEEPLWICFALGSYFCLGALRPVPGVAS
jgi:hypothetical protein